MKGGAIALERPCSSLEEWSHWSVGGIVRESPPTRERLHLRVRDPISSLMII